MQMASTAHQADRPHDASDPFVLVDETLLYASSAKTRAAVSRPDTTTSAHAGLPSRSKWGCLTCKAKHAKCDETKPACLACTAKGIPCGGYGPGIRWSTKHERFKGRPRPAGQSSSRSAHRPRRAVPAPAADEDGWRMPQLPILSRPPLALSSSYPTWDSGSPRSNPALFARADQLEAASLVSAESATDVFENAPGLAAPAMPQQAGSLSVSPRTEENDQDDEDSSNNSTQRNASVQLETASFPVPQTVVHTPSRLISYWFEEICTIWSAYDSHMNFNRTIASVLWHNSATVSYSLQNMSAAFLASRRPHMQQTWSSVVQEATTAIHHELAATKRLPQLTTIPTGLLFSLLCVGTTMCWVDGRQLGIPFLREAKALMRRMNREQHNFSGDDKNLLKFFNRSWAYCQMLLSFVTYDEPQDGDDGDGDDAAGEGRPILPPEQTQLDRVPHPWTGISAAPSLLFARAVSLCRRFRRDIRWETGVAVRDLRAALAKIEQAKQIEEQLLGLDYDTEAANLSLSDTGDQSTPYRHLVLAGEAYRLAALVHLYQTFPDLVALRLPKSLVAAAAASERGQVPWDDWIVPLTLRLVDLLGQLPADSGSKMVQPLLCITAGTGLRLCRRSHSAPGTGTSETAESARQRIAAAMATESRILEYIRSLGQEEDATAAPPEDAAIVARVQAARQFLLDRLDALETALPAQPIIVARDLIRAVWRAYDKEPPGAHAVHWVDVMEQRNLRSIFG